MNWHPTTYQLNNAREKFPNVDIDYQTLRFFNTIGSDRNTSNATALTKRWTAWLTKINNDNHKKSNSLITRGQTNRQILSDAVAAIERRKNIL